MRQQFLSKLETARVVHAKELHGCTSSGSSAFDPHTIDLEMFLPMIAARMKERYGLTRKWIDAAEVRSLAEVAAVASEREVVQPIVAPMLLGNDVLNMMSQGAMFLSKQAILATAIGPSADLVPLLPICRCRGMEFNLRRAFNWTIAIRSAALMSASYSFRSASVS